MASALTTDLAQVAERPGAKATMRYVRMSASKVRVVLDLIRGKRVEEALEILEFTERLAAQEIRKCLRSAVANAGHNEDIPEAELYVSVAFADEGPTIKRFRPGARGRAGRINKQTCHITVEVSRISETELDEMRSVAEAKAKGRQSRSTSKRSAGGDRAARVAKSKAAAATADESDAEDETATDDAPASSSDEAAPAADGADDGADDGAAEDTVTDEADDSNEGTEGDEAAAGEEE